MRTIIYGLGKIGTRIAETLSSENHDVIIIGSDKKRMAEIQQNLDVLCIERKIGDADMIKKSNMKNADIFIAVSESDEENIVACLIAKRQNVGKIIARISNISYLDNEIINIFDTGIDHVIHPEIEVAKEIVRLIRSPWASEVESFLNEQVFLIEIKVNEDNLDYLNEKLKLLHDTGLTIIIEPAEDKEYIRPFDKRQKLKLNDNLFLLEKKSDSLQINHIFKDAYAKIQNIIIVGGGSTGEELLEMLQGEKLNIKLIEKSKKRCRELSEKAKKAIILWGDGTNLNLLVSENIEKTDCFIAITSDDENNIMASLFAKQKGVKKSITRVSKAYEEEIIDKVGLDTTVNINKVTVNEILKFVRRKELIAISIINEDIEIMEFSVKYGSKITKKPLKDVQFTKGAIIGAVYHNEEVFSPKKNFKIEPGDNVLVFVHKNRVSKVERYFKSKK